MGEDGINFSWARNQCIEKCTGDWIFMTEGHERLVEGEDILLSLDQVMPETARVGFVLRQGNGQQWAFPWLFRNSKEISFKRPVHNVLDFPEGTFCVTLANVKTLHDRHHDRSATRAKQRQAQNRTALLDDWLSRKSEASLFYLGQEWRDIDPAKCVDRLEQFLTVSNNGVQRYQARLILAKQYMIQKDAKNAFRVLHGCTADDWTRSEHFAWLGDVAFTEKDFEKAYTFYKLATTKIGCPPITVWWIDLMYYSYLPAQRMAMVCGELGRHEEALVYCEQILELLPFDAPSEAFEEARGNVTIVKEALGEP
jgi:tetratricopeptide (TPR) repeat protein